MTIDEIVAELRSHANADNVAGMARYGISPVNTLGVNIPTIRALAKRAGRDHMLAQQLWDTGIHEARILAAMVDEPAKVTRRQMDRWAADFDSWDVVDGCCGTLFDKTPHAYAKAMQWSASRGEYVKRAGFVLMTQLAVHDKRAPDEAMLQFLPVIVRESCDERNFVKKAVNWALRQIGKRNRRLNAAAIATAREVLALDTRAGRWIARDALRELTSEAVQRRLKH
jgi:3-methyladenine DNA glycosylase AlkD